MHYLHTFTYFYHGLLNTFYLNVKMVVYVKSYFVVQCKLSFIWRSSKTCMFLQKWFIIQQIGT